MNIFSFILDIQVKTEYNPNCYQTTQQRLHHLHYHHHHHHHHFQNQFNNMIRDNHDSQLPINSHPMGPQPFGPTPKGPLPAPLPTYQRRGSLQLWQFLVALLDNPANTTFIAWTGRGLEFKLIEPEEVIYIIYFLSMYLASY